MIHAPALPHLKWFIIILHFVKLKVCLYEDKLTGEELPSSGEMSSDLKVEAPLAPPAPHSIGYSMCFNFTEENYVWEKISYKKLKKIKTMSWQMAPLLEGNCTLGPLEFMLDLKRGAFNGLQPLKEQNAPHY